MNQLLLDSALEALDLSRAEPGLGLLERLFVRFNDRVPFETASKIERDAAVADPAEKPRRPELFWTEHLERGAGGTCFARVAAFDALVSALGFRARRLLGRVTEDFDHAGLLVTAGERAWIADVGFPVPALVAAEPGEVETALGTVAVSKAARGWRIELGGVPEGPRELELFSAEVADGEYEARWRATFRADSKFLEAVALRRTAESRAISFAKGAVRVDDLHSRLTVPLPGPRSRKISELFGVEEELLQAALDRVGDPDPDEPDSGLVAYLETGSGADRALEAISDAAGYARLFEGVADVVSADEAPGGFLVRLRAPGAASENGLFEDRAVFERERRRLRVERRGTSSRSESSYEVLERGGKTYLARGLKLPGRREDLLRNDSLRGRLAGSLAAELLGWGRLVGVRG